jgi:uncharacterized tellurite resistance protein B-like protein
MSFSDFVTDYGKKINKSHYITLIQVCQIDGKISPEELKMLYTEGRKFGLADPEIEQLIEGEKYHEYHTPYSLDEKFSQLYNVAAMILADNVVTEGERKAIKRIATEAGFNDEAIENLRDILLEGIANKEDEEILLEKFKKVLFKK